jgi:hypothetical protein
VARVARYLVGNGYEVVCEMEQLPKHRDRLLWVTTESPSPSRSAAATHSLVRPPSAFGSHRALLVECPACAAPYLPIGTRRWLGSQNRRNSQNATASVPARMENLTTRSATLVSAASISRSMNHRPKSRASSSNNITRDIGPGRAVHNCRSAIAQGDRDRLLTTSRSGADSRG